jgi:hypothetical protein
MDNYLRQLISIKFEDMKDIYTGFLIDYTDEWILLKNNPVDFILDGFVVLRNKNVQAIFREPEYDFIEKVIKLKGLKTNSDDIIPLRDLFTILTFIASKYGVFQIATKSDKAVYLGRINEFTDDELSIDFLDPQGRWDGVKYFKPSKIRVIEFDTDYINSLKLAMEERNEL